MAVQERRLAEPLEPDLYGLGLAGVAGRLPAIARLGRVRVAGNVRLLNDDAPAVQGIQAADPLLAATTQDERARWRGDSAESAAHLRRGADVLAERLGDEDRNALWVDVLRLEANWREFDRGGFVARLDYDEHESLDGVLRWLHIRLPIPDGAWEAIGEWLVACDFNPLEPGETTMHRVIAAAQAGELHTSFACAITGYLHERDPEITLIHLVHLYFAANNLQANLNLRVLYMSDPVPPEDPQRFEGIRVVALNQSIRRAEALEILRRTAVTPIDRDGQQLQRAVDSAQRMHAATRTHLTLTQASAAEQDVPYPALPNE